MGLTYTRVDDRQRRRPRAVALSLGELLLLATSAVIALAILLAYAGRVRAEAWSHADRPPPVNLNAVVEAGALEATLAAVFTYPADRRFAATTVAAHLRDGATPRALPNIGALARIEVESQAIARDRSLVTFRERLDGAGATMALFTPAQLATLKPHVSVRTVEEFRSSVIWHATTLLLSVHLVSLVWRWRGVAGDRVLLAVIHLLVGLGFVAIMSRPDPLRDTLLLVRYTQGVALGAALCGLVSAIDLKRAAFGNPSYVPLFGALALSGLLLVFGHGPGSSGAKVNLGPVQPIEVIRLLLGLFLAGYFARRWELLRQVRTETVRGWRLPSWINLPRLDHVLPVVAGVAAALVLFFVQKDLGPALLLALMFLALFAVAHGGAWLAGAGLMGLAGGVAVGHALNISTTLAARLEMWRSPWDNAARGGDQVAQALWGLAAGATTGTGLGLGHARFIPEGHTDLVLAAIGEELGLAGLLVVGLAFALLAWRGFAIAQRASSDYRFFLALAMTLSLTIPVLVMAAGILGLLPLTGVVTPFLSYGGSAMIANFAALGLLIAIDRDRRPAADLAPFRLPVQWLRRTAAVCGVVLLTTVVTVQAVRADAYLVRPQLGVQADGGRRFQYNPRVLEALQSVPRGTIFDHRGVPLATSDPRLVGAATAEYARLGLRVAQSCATPADRCYPVGPSAFHLLGDANTRANWAAANTSYVERDAEDRLRGFDDGSRTVTTRDRDGRPARALRRDYSATVPLVRHRYEPDHPEAIAFRSRSRDVRTTIDLRLQHRVAAIVERAAHASGSGKGAVVVLDAATGQILASVSYPWPGAALGAASGGEALLDRGRYGLYPPGSTFKMITAAAALRDGPRASERPFLCLRLPSGRSGVRLPGFGPPIHDDANDRHAHGEITMHDGLVRSCNAYFAQLAVAVGAEALTRTAATAGIAVNTSRSDERVRANLPHAGYGQGEVVVSPLRLARVAAAIGTDGAIREAPIVAGTGSTIESPFVTATTAQTLAGYLRDAVLDGTGRSLRDHPARIAGKTGTAEVDDAGSHAWFTGFAPHGAATRRIAFAVILEHAGYGGVAAARVAGEVATEAMALGLVK